MERLRAFAQARGWQDFEVVAEIGSGLNGKRRKLLRVLKDPTVGRIVVEHRDRLARFGFELVEAALYASGKQLVVVAVHLGERGPKAEGEVKDDLVRDLLKVLTSACERPMKRSARDRVKRNPSCYPSIFWAMRPRLWARTKESTLMTKPSWVTA